MATATDFQSLISSPNVACFSNLSPGEWMGVKLALLQGIVQALNPAQPTDYNTLLGLSNVACFLSMPPGLQNVIKLALLQDIVLNIGTGGGGSPWTPNVPIPGATLIEWVKGDTLTGSSGSQISDWPASAGVDLTQTPGSGATPTLLTGTYFHPVARFNGTSDLMTGNGFAGSSQPVTLAIVFSYQGSLSATGTIIDFGSAAGPPNFGTAGGQFIANAGTSVNLKAADSALHILLMTFNGASSVFSFDGVSLSSFSPGTSPLINLEVGATADIANFSQVDVGEILVWSGDASSYASQIFSYLSGRWITA
jgi:hypothetical protein